MSRSRPILYHKPGCPWCIEALNFFDSHGVDLDLRDVIASRADRDRLIALTGLDKTPTLEMGEFVCADFSVDELQDALSRNPEVRKRLGLGDEDE